MMKQGTITRIWLIPMGLLAMSSLSASAWGTEPRPRARDLGLSPGVFRPGPGNAITDLPGVRVGHSTLVQEEHIRTGVTAILPHEGNLFQEKVAAGVFVGNAFGKLAGSTQVEELGTIEAPILLTNTLAVGVAVEAGVAYTLKQPGNESVRSINVVVGEINDGTLNDIRGLHVRREHVLEAIQAATNGPVPEGNVGGGTGAIGFGWKAGIGTASRIVPERFGGYRVGVLVQTNFGGVLTMQGAPVGQHLGRSAFAPVEEPDPTETEPPEGTGDGSCVIVVATDAPLDARDLRRLSARAVFGLARTGSSYTSGSGDYALAFSTAPDSRSQAGDRTARPRALLPPEAVSPLFQATLEATEEAVYNSLLRASTMTSRGRTVEAIPIDRVREILDYHRIINNN